MDYSVSMLVTTARERVDSGLSNLQLVLINTLMIPWFMPEKSVLSTLSVFFTFLQNGNRTEHEDEESHIEGP